MQDQTPLETPDETAQPVQTETPETPIKNRKRVIFLAVLLLVVIVGAALMLIGKNNEDQADSTASTKQDTQIASFADCAAAGNPIQESFPEVCVTADGKSFVNETQQKESEAPAETVVAAPTCAETQTVFADKDFGAAFCYPTVWGTASVMDAKIDTSDTGYREAVRFSGTTKFIVGGVSEDWTTTIGRDVGCQEPSNRVAELSSYNVDWHDLVGEGMSVEFATRSLPVSVGGYDITETVSDLLSSGVCAQGHKIINGSRYKVVSAAYYSDFSESIGITTPKAHIDNPALLFTTADRAALDSVLASVVAY